ncbi:DUF2303 family protein [Verticiella sediminum]|uniref:DUF2303 family protein n=1 Tax=Verticiella sediminum TaxID=1247510 RepID=A0A556AIC7_9BURK|nr:DUF2303 family protein [Verticiella sediminum]TSH92650.1 DUF2303 family protein [Verticiella sediminum]
MQKPSNEVLAASADANIAETAARLAPRPEIVVEAADAQGRLIAVPEGYHIETDEALRKLEDTPRRKIGSVALRTPESFIEYVNRHKQPETLLYTTVDATAMPPLNMTAIFNEHAPGEYLDSPAGWCDFRAEFAPKVAFEWATWTKQDRKPMNQAEFAEFIENNIKDIATQEGFPTGTAMHQLATKFEITSDKRIRSAVRVQSGGVDIEYVDNEDAETTSRMQSFDRFQLGIPAFWQGQAYRLEARLRYRLREGKLTLWYELVRPDLVLDAAVETMVADIVAGTDTQVLYGAPK